jgi:hypothetical protein
VTLCSCAALRRRELQGRRRHLRSPQVPKSLTSSRLGAGGSPTAERVIYQLGELLGGWWPEPASRHGRRGEVGSEQKATQCLFRNLPNLNSHFTYRPLNFPYTPLNWIAINNRDPNIYINTPDFDRDPIIYI